jgi:hypothetical protein
LVTHIELKYLEETACFVGLLATAIYMNVAFLLNKICGIIKWQSTLCYDCIMLRKFVFLHYKDHFTTLACACHLCFWNNIYELTWNLWRLASLISSYNIIFFKCSAHNLF